MGSKDQSRCVALIILFALIIVLSDMPISESRRMKGIKRGVAGTWCIANPLLGGGQLQQAIDFCCARVNCGIIQPGGSCFDPNTIVDHASVALDLYYKATGSHPQNCNLNSWGIITVQDPSHGSCVFP